MQSSQPLQHSTDSIYRVPQFDAVEWLEHGFGTRHATDWPDTTRLVTAKQVHSATVLEAVDGAGQAGSGDALITDRPGLLLGVRTADCTPILMVDTRRRAVAAVHAGWRGSAQRISVCTISAMTARFGTAACDVWAAIGPAIGVCCYEVGPEVARQFVPWLSELGDKEGPVKLNLQEVNRRQLIEAGVLPEHIFAGAPCTFCTADRFHSYRRDREEAGRMLSCIGIRAGI